MPLFKIVYQETHEIKVNATSKEQAERLYVNRSTSFCNASDITDMKLISIEESQK